jgi:lipopolysaccharide export system protein LptA
MRHAARWLLLLTIFGTLGWLGHTYKAQRHDVEQQAPKKPDLLPVDVSGKAEDWHWSKFDEKGVKIVEVWAKTFKQEKDSSVVNLEGVRLHLFHQQRDQYDRVQSPAAAFRPSEDKLYADGEVLITLAVPTDGLPTHRLVAIHTSGVTFDSKSGRATTGRAADFTFQNGTGRCVGATYDPNTKELQMNSAVQLNLNAKGPNGKPMQLESGQLVYKEQLSQILLFPWARLKRDTSTIDGADTTVTLKDGAVSQVDAKNAKGVDLDPDRQLEYSADHVIVHYTDDGDIDKVTGEPNARLISSTQYARTTTTTDRIDLEFSAENHQTTLKTAFAHGHGYIESKPTGAAPGEQLADTRILRSETIEMKMRPGGKEIDMIATHSPGHLEFLPNHPGPRRRQMDGERLYITYGQRNMVQSFRSVDVATRTDPVNPNGAPSQTWSKNLLADFDPKTGQLSRMKQWDDFRYVEGARKAVAKQATLDQDTNRMTLEAAARVWDPSGSTSGDVIHLDQASGNFTAEGHVSSSRIQDKKKQNTDLLSGDEPVQATAQRMVSTNHNSYIRYEGKADMWQGANRIRADRIEIDREAQRLVAAGSVETQLSEKQKDQQDGTDGKTPNVQSKPASRVFTVVKASGLVYTDNDRLSYYTGGVLLTRPKMRIKSLELRAYLSEAGSDNSLERAYADGKVEIQQNSPGRTRTGASDHAEYYAAEDKIVLRGGSPVFSDSLKGNTRGAELTYYAADDRLLFVDGVPQQPAASRLRRK